MKKKLFKISMTLLIVFIIPFLFGYGSRTYTQEFLAVLKENAQNGSFDIIELVEDLTSDFQAFPDYLADFDNDQNIWDTLKSVGNLIVHVNYLIFDLLATPLKILRVVLQYTSGFLKWYFRMFRGVI